MNKHSRSMHKAIISQLGTGYGLPAFIALILFFTASSWIGDGVEALIENWQFYKDNKDFLQLVFGLIIFCSLYFYGSYKLKNIMPDIDVETNDTPGRCKGLIIFLSPPSATSEIKITDIASIADFEGKRHNWEMPCKAIDYHKERLTHLAVVLPSVEKQAEIRADFESLVKRLFNSDLKITFSEAIDFENLEKVYEEIARQFENLQNSVLKERDIVIDVTGGQKTVSIAGAIYTFGYDRKFQYVSTNTKKVLSYDIRYDFDRSRK